MSSSGLLFVMSLSYVLCIVSLALSLALSLASSLTLSLAEFPFLLTCSRSAYFSLYIVSLDKQLWVELAAN